MCSLKDLIFEDIARLLPIFFSGFHDLDPVVQKPINTNLRLKVNRGFQLAR